MLLTAENFYQAPSSGRWAEAAHRQHGDGAPFPESKGDGVLPVFVNGGRWIAQCPCGSAEVASETDHRFFCTNCHNESAANGEWVATHWPDERDQIDRLLEPRPVVNQNWRVGESVENLKAENLVRGLDVLD